MGCESGKVSQEKADEMVFLVKVRNSREGVCLLDLRQKRCRCRQQIIFKQKEEDVVGAG